MLYIINTKPEITIDNVLCVFILMNLYYNVVVLYVLNLQVKYNRKVQIIGNLLIKVLVGKQSV